MEREVIEYFAYMVAGLAVGICAGLIIIYLIEVLYG